MSILSMVLRAAKGAPLTNAEMDANLQLVLDYFNGKSLPQAAGPDNDLNLFTAPGLYHQPTNTGATSGLNYPIRVDSTVAEAGMLEVWSGQNSAGTVTSMLYQTYYSYHPSSPAMFTRRYYNSVWGPWRQLAFMDQAQTQVLLTAATDVNTLVAANTRYVWTNGVVINSGTNWPTLGYAVARGSVDVIAFSSTQIYQRLTLPLAGDAHSLVFDRYGTVGGTWYPWRIASQVSSTTWLPSSDCGDVYVDGDGWYKWSGTAYTRASYASTLPTTTHDLNNYQTPGVFRQSSTAGAQAGTNYPVQIGGLLEVAGTGAAGQTVQWYTVASTGSVTETAGPRKFWRFAINTTWSPWQEVFSASLNRDHGQCRFNWVSATECRLVPLNGNGIIVNGKQYRIPTAGVSLSNSGLAANTAYYVYAKDNGSGALALEAMLTTVGHGPHTDGVEIRSGDPTRTLVGFIRTNASIQFVHSTTFRWVASWFNRTPFALLEGPTNSQTSSTSYTQLTNGFSALIWARDLVTLTGSGVAWSASANGGGYWIIAANGTGIAGGYGNNFPVAGSLYSTAISSVYSPATDAAVSFAPYGQTSLAANPVTFKQDFAGTVLQ